MKRAGITILAVAAGLVLSGCSTGTDPVSPQDSGSAAIEQAKKYRAHIAGAALGCVRTANTSLRLSAGAITGGVGRQAAHCRSGVVDGWQKGPATESYPGGPLEHRVVMRVRITELLKEAERNSTMPRGIAYVEFNQGAVLRDDTKPVEE